MMTIEQRAGEAGSRPRVLAGGPRPPGTGPARGSGTTDGLAELLRTVGEHRGLVAALVLASLAAGVLYLAAATPRYQSNLLVKIESPSRASQLLTEPAGSPRPEQPNLEPEVEVLRSRSLLAEVVEELGLAIEAAPRRFPLLGAAMARRHTEDTPAPARFGQARYGWGGERIRVERLNVPDELIDTPLRIVALEDGRFRILSARGAPGLEGLEGQVGQPLHRDGREKLDLLVSELVARPGTEFVLQRRREVDVVRNLQARLGVFEKAKMSGVVSVALDGPDPKQTAAILDALAERYLRRGESRAAAEAERALQIVEAQLPIRKAAVDAAESALAAFQQRKNISMATEGQSIANQRAELERSLATLEQQWIGLRQRYTDNHPAVAEAAAKLRGLRARMAALDARQRQLPRSELEAGRLAREIRVATEQYQRLLGEAQLLRIAKAGAAPHAWVLDAALVPSRPMSPRPGPVLTLATLLGVAAGVCLAFVMRGRALSSGALESITGLPVLAALPRRCARRKHLVRRRSRDASQLLSVLDPTDVAVDELWALRANLELVLGGGPRAVVAVLGPGPEVGKSFVCANLARVLAASGRRVLLIDADLRRGSLHRYFPAPRQPGLAEVVQGEALLEGALVHSQGVDLLRCGATRAAPMGLLSGAAFEALLAQLASRYDVVLIDTAPVLAVADALPVARLADVNLLVLHARKDPGREAARALLRLERAGVGVDGLVLNEMRVPRDKYAAYRAAAHGEPAEDSKGAGAETCSRPSAPGPALGP